MDQDCVITGLLREAHGDGADTPTSARLRAWELLGKHLECVRTGVQHEGSEQKPTGLADSLSLASETEGVEENQTVPTFEIESGAGHLQRTRAHRPCPAHTAPQSLSVGIRTWYNASTANIMPEHSIP